MQTFSHSLAQKTVHKHNTSKVIAPSAHSQNCPAFFYKIQRMAPYHLCTAVWGKKTEGAEAQGEIMWIPKIFETDGNPLDWQIFKLLFIWIAW